jgi:hypothetical protein
MTELQRYKAAPLQASVTIRRGYWSKSTIFKKFPWQ